MKTKSESSLTQLTRKDKGKGFKRTEKQWKNTIAEHIGKFIDRIEPSQIPDLIAAVFCAWGGFEAAGRLQELMGMEPRGPIQDQLVGAGLGLLSYKLSISGSEIGAAAGLITLGSMGFVSLPWAQWGQQIMNVLKALGATDLDVQLPPVLGQPFQFFWFPPLPAPRPPLGPEKEPE